MYPSDRYRLRTWLDSPERAAAPYVDERSMTWRVRLLDEPPFDRRVLADLSPFQAELLIAMGARDMRIARDFEPIREAALRR